MKILALTRHLRLTSLVLLSLTSNLCAWGQTTMGAPNNSGMAGSSTGSPTTTAATGTSVAFQIPGAPQLNNAQAQPSGLARPITPDGSTGLPPPLRPTLPALQKIEFQNFTEESTGQRLPLHGYNLFDGGLFTPTQNVPVPGDYVLGAGDEVQLRVWGSIDADLRLVIDRNGQVSVPKAGTFTLAGIKASDLNAVMRAQISRYFNNFQVAASLGQLRSLPVFVVGQARKPGAYNLSSLSTLISALNGIGSARSSQEEP